MCPHFFLQSNDKKLLSLSCRSFMRVFLQYVYDQSVSGGGVVRLGAQLRGSVGGGLWVGAVDGGMAK